ncbi:hypothetical protein DXG01_002490 [Tephrocybe rancida]|nr:hypothetical protein DXG01_002490 [Tephrocybe rancida]
MATCHKRFLRPNDGPVDGPGTNFFLYSPLNSVEPLDKSINEIANFVVARNVEAKTEGDKQLNALLEEHPDVPGATAYALLVIVPLLVQALPTEYEAVYSRGNAKNLSDKDFLLSCPGAAGSPNVQRADRCTLVNIKNNPDKIIFQNLGSPQLNCAGGTTPTSVTLGGSTSVSTTTTVNVNMGISFAGISIGGGMSTSDTKSTSTSKSITYTVPPGRQAILTAGIKFKSQTGNVQVNYGDRVNDHYIWFTGATITKLIPSGEAPQYQIHETKCVRLALNDKCYISGMRPRSASPPPLKRARLTQSPVVSFTNGHMPQALPPLSLSILGVEPLDEFIKEIADFIHHMIITRPDFAGNIEVEAKIGVLRDKASGQRVGLPVLVESSAFLSATLDDLLIDRMNCNVVLAPDSVDCRFESNMSVNQHKHYNSLLNNLMTTSAQPGHPSSQLKYSHLHLVDSFYPSDGHEKVRVTRDEQSGNVIACMRKIRLGDLNIYSPKRAADWRISVNLEVPTQHPLGSPTHTRKKDRMSYAHEEFAIDLTKVTSTTSPGAPPQILYELELEIGRPEVLLATAATRGDVNLPEHERSAFDELIRAFVNNARILVRNSSDGWQ